MNACCVLRPALQSRVLCARQSESKSRLYGARTYTTMMSENDNESNGVHRPMQCGGNRDHFRVSSNTRVEVTGAPTQSHEVQQLKPLASSPQTSFESPLVLQVEHIWKRFSRPLSMYVSPRLGQVQPALPVSHHNIQSCGATGKGDFGGFCERHALRRRRF